MRWKLLLIASLIASIVGTGAMLSIVVFLLGSTRRLASPDIIAFGTILIPALLIAAAGIFVYRHTARRRKTQAMVTILLSSILTLTLILLGMMLLSNPAQEQPPSPQPNRIASIS